MMQLERKHVFFLLLTEVSFVNKIDLQVGPTLTRPVQDPKAGLKPQHPTIYKELLTYF